MRTQPGASGVPVIVGAGLAGLMTALRLAPQPSLVLAAGRLGDGTASGWAQGGLAAAVGDDDSPELHAMDTLAAGVGLCDARVVRRITAAAPQAVADLCGLGVRFDRSSDGALRLGLEGAHGRRRIVHALGDATGAEIMRAVVAAVRAEPAITVLEGAIAHDLLIRDGQVAGVSLDLGGRPMRLDTDRVVLATGGAGQLWLHTTNPRGARGQGLAMAARAGAVLRDLEMVQFHPTALDVGGDPMPLVSEAVRGAGARLVDADGRPLTDDPLAARDVVSRVLWRTVSTGGRAFLDARRAPGERLSALFPTVTRACLAAGINPAIQPIPVRPAAHYQCGGVLVDGRGRSSVPGLWAVGEVASTGLHGANRLASNSLLEAVVCGGWVAADLAVTVPRAGGPRLSDDSPSRPEPCDDLAAVRPLMSRVLGVTRTGGELRSAVAGLVDAVASAGERAGDATLLALLVASSALRREESRGGHARLDHPETHAVALHTTVTLAGALEATSTIPELALTGDPR